MRGPVAQVSPSRANKFERRVYAQEKSSQKEASQENSEEVERMGP
jgi:hypothetical protein